MNVFLGFHGSVFHTKIGFGCHGAEEAGVDDSRDALELFVHLRPIERLLDDVEAPVEEEIAIVGHDGTSLVHSHTETRFTAETRF